MALRGRCPKPQRQGLKPPEFIRGEGFAPTHKKINTQSPKFIYEVSLTPRELRGLAKKAATFLVTAQQILQIFMQL